MPLPQAADAIVDPLDGLLGYQLRRASAVMMADLAETLSEFGLSASQASVLMVIAANTEPTQSEVGRCLGVKRANMAPLVAELMAAGLVARSAVDGRSQALRLSETGRREAVRIRARIDAHESRFLADCGPDARRHLVDQLRAIRRRAATAEA